MGIMTHDERARKAQQTMDDAAVAAGNNNPTLAAALIAMSQVHALLAIYEALILPGYGISVGDNAEWTRENR